MMDFDQNELNFRETQRGDMIWLIDCYLCCAMIVHVVVIEL